MAILSGSTPASVSAASKQNLCASRLTPRLLPRSVQLARPRRRVCARAAELVLHARHSLHRARPRRSQQDLLLLRANRAVHHRATALDRLVCFSQLKSTPPPTCAQIALLLHRLGIFNFAPQNLAGAVCVTPLNPYDKAGWTVFTPIFYLIWLFCTACVHLGYTL